MGGCPTNRHRTIVLPKRIVYNILRYALQSEIPATEAVYDDSRQFQVLQGGETMKRSIVLGSILCLVASSIMALDAYPRTTIVELGTQTG